MSENLPQVPEPKESVSLWKRIGIYLGFAVAITLLLIILTPGFFYDEAVFDIILFIVVAVLEFRKKPKK